MLAAECLRAKHFCHRRRSVSAFVLFGKRRGINHLYRVSFRIQAIKTVRSVPMRAEFGFYGHAVCIQVLMPDIDVFGSSQHDAQVIKSSFAG